MLKIPNIHNVCHYIETKHSDLPGIRTQFSWTGGTAKQQITVTKNDIKFYLHCPKTEYILQIENFTKESMKCPKKAQMKILVHGWQADKDTEWYDPAIKAYMQTEKTNLLAIDWGKYAKGLYTTSVDLVKSIGEIIGDAVIDIATNLTLNYKDFHLVGHSLGAHICGYAGKHVIAKKGLKIGRITGCDPAGPAFEGNHPDDRLYAYDAEFVDVIHTDAGILGYEKSLGHIDFYPNGGKKQYGCTYTNSEVGCSHCRAPIYMAESITSHEFVAVKAKNLMEFETVRYADNSPRTLLGEHVDKKLRGDFYLYTNKNPPYARGKI